jgi:hypothetical protein
MLTGELSRPDLSQTGRAREAVRTIHARVERGKPTAYLAGNETGIDVSLVERFFAIERDMCLKNTPWLCN